MFMFVAFFFIFLIYVILIKSIYHRYRQKLTVLQSKRLLKLNDDEDTGFRPTHDSPQRHSENEAQLSDVRALVVTAHPDDECMFFAPTILRLIELNASVNLLCLSSGNYYKQGVQRQKELFDSAAVLGIPASRVTIIDNKEFPDDPRVEWSIPLTSSLVLKHIRAHSINLVLTFDGRGVSGHANHVDIYKALSYLASVGKIPDGCQVLALQTINILRKYLSVLELPISWLLPSDFCCVIGSKEYKQAKRAMFCHRSQLLWFRHLYLLFSRYMFVNTFQAIAQERKDLKIY